MKVSCYINQSVEFRTQVFPYLMCTQIKVSSYHPGGAGSAKSEVDKRALQQTIPGNPDLAGYRESILHQVFSAFKKEK